MIVIAMLAVNVLFLFLGEENGLQTMQEQTLIQRKLHQFRFARRQPSSGLIDFPQQAFNAPAGYFRGVDSDHAYSASGRQSSSSKYFFSRSASEPMPK